MEAIFLPDLSMRSIALIGIVTFFPLYIIIKTIYRLFFSPLAKFPGPKIVAATSLYEAYYEIILKGQYSRKISEFHDLYGPIIRVAPNEIHIRDGRFFDQLYLPKSNKDGWDKRFNSEHSVLTTRDEFLHRRRRAALSPMFSRRSILTLMPIILKHVETLSQRVEEFRNSKEPLVLSDAFPALTGDIIMDYFFGFCYDQLKSPDFASFHEAFTATGLTGHIAAQIPWILPLMTKIPEHIAEKMQPALASLLRLKQDQWDCIGRTLRDGDTCGANGHRTIFQEILDSKLPPEDKTHQRLADEAQIVVGGGVETTAYALSIASFHIINTPRIYKRLHCELINAMPILKDCPLDLIELEKLPYLRVCILEATRLSYGLSARNPRTQRGILQYQDYIIPANTSVSMTVTDISHDESIFSNSREYIPERWLDSPLTDDGLPLEKFHTSFGRGPRSCLGVNLAWAELTLTLAMIFRRYKFELFETDVSDVEMKHDFFIPTVKLESKGVRVFVATADD